MAVLPDLALRGVASILRGQLWHAVDHLEHVAVAWYAHLLLDLRPHVTLSTLRLHLLLVGLAHFVRRRMEGKLIRRV